MHDDAPRDSQLRHGRSVPSSLALGAVLALLAFCGTGCQLDSWFNPSVVGYWEPQPTTIPILERIDVIEKDEDPWGQTTTPTSEDLIPSDLSYRVAAGDVVTVQIWQLFEQNQWSSTTRRVDQGGLLKVPELGNIQAAGRTPEEIQSLIEAILVENYMREPLTDVVVEQGGAFTYTIDGSVTRPGLYTLQGPDLRLREALAVGGGVSPLIEKIFVLRQIELTERTSPWYDRRPGASVPSPPDAPATDIESLIDEQLRNDAIAPAAFPQDDPIIDIDDLEPVRIGNEPAIDIDEVRERARQANRGSWIYVEERGEWVRIEGQAPAGTPSAARSSDTDDPPLYVERIIEIEVDRLLHGDSRSNIIVRPDDLIYVEAPPTGVIYIDGQISRPGVYQLPVGGVTLSRLVASAGGLNGIAIPSRVDLVRIVGDNREAALTLDLGAIRHRTEPDVWLKPNDHIIIGTSLWASPLAVLRNGFRATYGFGFLLDRNFGNDVFGAPPSNNRF